MCEECHEWTDERCKSVADYVKKLYLQRKRKKERKTKSSSSSSFSSFPPSIPVLLGQLPSPADSGVVTTSASLSAVCVVMFTVAEPAVTAAPVVSTPAVTPAEHPRKCHHVTDLKERELMMLHFEDCWSSGRLTPWPEPSSASQLSTVTAVVVVSSAVAFRIFVVGRIIFLLGRVVPLL